MCLIITYYIYWTSCVPNFYVISHIKFIGVIINDKNLNFTWKYRKTLEYHNRKSNFSVFQIWLVLVAPSDKWNLNRHFY